MVALHGCGADAGMDGCIAGAHIVLKEPAKLRQRGDGIQIQRVEPGLLEGPELAFCFGPGGTITDLCV